MKKNQKGFVHLGIVFVLIVLSAIGAMGYYVYNSNENKKQTTQNTDTSMTTNSTDQKQTETSASPETESTIKPTYAPANLFTESEKSELNKKLVQPNVDYAEQYKDKAGYNPVVSITITKKTDAEYASQPEYAKYRYSVKVVSKSGATSDFLYAEKDVVDWWLPECFDGNCGLTEAFKSKYPEIAAKLKAQGNTP